MEVYLSYSFDKEQGWSGEVELGLCQDTQTMIEAFEQLWPHRPRFGPPTKVAVTLLRLVPDRCAPLPLFPEAQKRTRLAHVIDDTNTRFGPQSIYLAATQEVRDDAPTRIAFSQVPVFHPAV